MLILLMNNAYNKKDSVTNYNNDLPTTPVKINSLSTTIALPASQLVITGSGFSSIDNLSVRFSENISYQVDVPVLQSSSTSLIVSVPPFITSDNAPFLHSTENFPEQSTTLLNFEFGALLLFPFDRIIMSYHKTIPEELK